VRPSGEVAPDWAKLIANYDQHLGFPAPELSEALVDQFAEVHRVRSLRGCVGWPIFMRMLGFPNMSDEEIDRIHCAAYRRAVALNYKQGGRHDHA